MAAIETRALARSFAGGIEAVAGIDLEVAAGEIYAFLGPNGAGKTTTVRMLTTLLRPSGGSATVAGYDVVSEAPCVRRSIGVALQEAALDPLMTGRELMRLQGTLHGLPRADNRSRAAGLLERVGLVEAADRRVGTYSGGMRRRLDLAMALVHAPRVLFLDEPTTGLDPVSRLSIWEEVRKLNDEGTTVLLTTQYLEEADQVADRVGIIDRGAMAAEGTPAELKAEIGRSRLELVITEGPSGGAAGGGRGDSPSDAGDPTREAPAGAREILSRFGELLPSRNGAVVVELSRGASQVAPVVRALDSAGLAVESLDLVDPTLDDVFVAKTGRRLEGSAEAAAAS